MNLQTLQNRHTRIHRRLQMTITKLSILQYAVTMQPENPEVHQALVQVEKDLTNMQRAIRSTQREVLAMQMELKPYQQVLV